MNFQYSNEICDAVVEKRALKRSQIMKKSSLILLSLLFGTIWNHSYAQPNKSVPKEIKKAFMAKADTLNGHMLLYRETLLSPASPDSVSLVVFLHGASGRGNDNLSQLKGTGVRDIYDYLSQNNIAAYFIAPQCPQTSSWTGRGFSGHRRPHRGPYGPIQYDIKQQMVDTIPYVEYLMPFLEKYVSEHPINTSKIYIVGRSMGAAGTWLLVANNPNFFTAAMMSSGGYRGKDIEAFLKTPIICTVGTQEPSFFRIKQLVERLQSAGADATFIPLNGADHREACDISFSKENLDLLFSKHR